MKIAEDKSKKSKFNHLNPLATFRTRDDAEKAAKSGVWVCAFLGASYILQIIFIYYTGNNTFGDEGDVIVNISNIIAVALAALLAWRVWAKQAFWATIFAAFWFSIEILMKINAILIGQQKTNAGWIIMFSALIIIMILSIRGSWKLKKERNSVPISGS